MCVCVKECSAGSVTLLCSHPRENEHNPHIAWQRGGLLTCLEREAGGAGCDGPGGFEMPPRAENRRATDIHVKGGPGRWICDECRMLAGLMTASCCSDVHEGLVRHPQSPATAGLFMLEFLKHVVCLGSGLEAGGFHFRIPEGGFSKASLIKSQRE